MVSRFYFVCIVLLVVLGQVSVQGAAIKCANPVQCLVDPCQFATCPNYPKAKCRSNYCGGCFADFYVGCKKVNCGTAAIQLPVDS